jgi:hypothetical protein
VENVWDFSKLKHKEQDDPAELILEVSKLITNMSSTAPGLCPVPRTQCGHKHGKSYIDKKEFCRTLNA